VADERVGLSIMLKRGRVSQAELGMAAGAATGMSCRKSMSLARISSESRCDVAVGASVSASTTLLVALGPWPPR
jgi:hypothetical protein